MSPAGTTAICPVGGFGVHRHGRAGAGLGEAARDGELRGLGHAVVDHVGRDLDAGFTADEDHAAPVAFLHRGQVAARQAHPAHHVDVEVALPVGIGDVAERLAFEDAQIADEDVDLGKALRDLLRTPCRRQIADEGLDLGVRSDRPDTGDSVGDCRCLAAIDDDARAFDRQHAGDGEADALAGAGDQGELAVQLQIHAVVPIG